MCRKTTEIFLTMINFNNFDNLDTRQISAKATPRNLSARWSSTVVQRVSRMVVMALLIEFIRYTYYSRTKTLYSFTPQMVHPPLKSQTVRRTYNILQLSQRQQQTTTHFQNKSKSRRFATRLTNNSQNLKSYLFHASIAGTHPPSKTKNKKTFAISLRHCQALIQKKTRSVSTPQHRPPERNFSESYLSPAAFATSEKAPWRYINSERRYKDLQQHFTTSKKIVNARRNSNPISH